MPISEVLLRILVVSSFLRVGSSVSVGGKLETSIVHLVILKGKSAVYGRIAFSYFSVCVGGELLATWPSTSIPSQAIYYLPFHLAIKSSACLNSFVLPCERSRRGDSGKRSVRSVEIRQSA